MRVNTKGSAPSTSLMAIREPEGCSNNTLSAHQPAREGRGAGSHTGGSETAHHPHRGVKTVRVLIKLIKSLISLTIAAVKHYQRDKLHGEEDLAAAGSSTAELVQHPCFPVHFPSALP